MLFLDGAVCWYLQGLASQQTFKQNRPTKAAKKQETASCVGHGAVSAGLEEAGLWRTH